MDKTILSKMVRIKSVLNYCTAPVKIYIFDMRYTYQKPRYTEYEMLRRTKRRSEIKLKQYLLSFMQQRHDIELTEIFVW